MTTLTWDRHRGHATGYDVLDVGFNYRIDEIRAALGVSQLRRLGDFNAARGILAAEYRERLAGHRGLQVPFSSPRGEPSFHIAPVLARSPDAREAIRAELKREGIQTSIHYPAIHRFTSYAGAGSLPVTDTIVDHVLTLPLHPGLTTETVDEICDILFRLVDGDGTVR